jgi:hypothetical protein
MSPPKPAVPKIAGFAFRETEAALTDWLGPGPCAGGTNGVTDDR